MDKEEIYNKWVTNKSPKELKYCVLEAMSEYSDTVNKSLLDKIIDQDKELIAYRSLLDDAVVRVAELESQLQLSNLQVKLNYDTSTILENKVKELEKENKWVHVLSPPKFSAAYIVVTDLEDNEQPISWYAEYDVKTNKWIDPVLNSECIVLFWMELPKPPMQLKWKPEPLTQEPISMDEYERTIYGQCVHGENLAKCEICNQTN